MAQAQVVSTKVEDAAIKAVYHLQYNTNKAARFIVGEVPATTFEQAVEVINRIVRPGRAAK